MKINIFVSNGKNRFDKKFEKALILKQLITCISFENEKSEFFLSCTVNSKSYDFTEVKGCSQECYETTLLLKITKSVNAS